MVDVGRVVSTWDDVSVLIRYVEAQLAQMGFVRCGTVRIVVDIELAEPEARALGDVELPFEGGV